MAGSISSDALHRLPDDAPPPRPGGVDDDGGWRPRDAFAAALHERLVRGSITLPDVEELIVKAGDDPEHDAFLYLALIRRGLSFEPAAADRLRAYLARRGANDTRSTLSRLVARMLGEDPVADEARFGERVTGALADRRVSFEEARELIREAAGNPRRMAMLDMALKAREPAFGTEARTAIRAFLIRAGANEPDSELARAIAELRLLYGAPSSP